MESKYSHGWIPYPDPVESHGPKNQLTMSLLYYRTWQSGDMGHQALSTSVQACPSKASYLGLCPGPALFLEFWKQA